MQQDFDLKHLFQSPQCTNLYHQQNLIKVAIEQMVLLVKHDYNEFLALLSYGSI